jgi:hypothetical protein
LHISGHRGGVLGFSIIQKVLLLNKSTNSLIFKHFVNLLIHRKQAWAFVSIVAFLPLGVCLTDTQNLSGFIPDSRPALRPRKNRTAKTTLSLTNTKKLRCLIHSKCESQTAQSVKASIPSSEGQAPYYS